MEAIIFFFAFRGKQMVRRSDYHLLYGKKHFLLLVLQGLGFDTKNPKAKNVDCALHKTLIPNGEDMEYFQRPDGLCATIWEAENIG